jgi:hypothetical protein
MRFGARAACLLLGATASLGQVEPESDASSLVRGLRPGEICTVAKGTVLRTADFARGRVIDAERSLPLEDVLVEAWTEDGTEPAGIAVCLDRTRTARDGSFALRAISGPQRASNFRYSRTGYETTVDGSWPEPETLLFAQRELAGRVIDLDGNPIAGAVVRSRQCCPHALCAVQVRTDAQGRFRIPDFPADDFREADVEILGELHGWIARAPASLARARTPEWRLSRGERHTVQLLDALGNPLAGRRVVHDSTPFAEAWTDHRGVVDLPPAIAQSGAPIAIRDGAGRVAFPPAILASGTQTVLRALAPRTDALPVTYATTSVTLHWNALRGPPLLQLTTPAGFVYEGEGSHVLPRGYAKLVIGAPFEGWRQEVRELKLGYEPVTLDIAPVEEPLLRVLLPPESYARIVVGTRTFADVDVGPTKVFEHRVPPANEIRVLAERWDGEARLGALRDIAPEAPSLELDLTHPESIVAPGLETGGLRSTLRFVPPAGESPAPFEGDVDVAGLDNLAVDQDSGPLSVPAGRPFSVALRREGCMPLRVHARAPQDGSELPIALAFVRCALLEVRGNYTALESFRGFEKRENDEDLRFVLAPGPLTLCVVRNERPLWIELSLEPGEHRTLTVR